jgi:flagellin-specific chaperone FliS
MTDTVTIKALGSLEKYLIQFDHQSTTDIFKGLDNWLDGEANCNITSVERVHELLQLLEAIRKEKNPKEILKNKEKLFEIFEIDSRKREVWKQENKTKKKSENTSKNVSEYDVTIPGKVFLKS